ncbi:hypothetical protein BKA81DRAFT_398835 [Phyllosticta paracitricarpa]
MAEGLSVLARERALSKKQKVDQHSGYPGNGSQPSPWFASPLATLDHDSLRPPALLSDIERCLTLHLLPQLTSPSHTVLSKQSTQSTPAGLAAKVPLARHTTEARASERRKGETCKTLLAHSHERVVILSILPEDHHQKRDDEDEEEEEEEEAAAAAAAAQAVP